MPRSRRPTVLSAPRLRGLVAALGLMLGLAVLGPTPGEAAPSEAEAFRKFEAAWQRARAGELVQCVPAKGHVHLKLLGRPFSGASFQLTRERALRSLEDYFGRIIEPRLRDRTTRKQRSANPHVRLYDFTYRPRKGSTVTTRLMVQVRQDPERRWMLDTVRESRK